MGWYTLDSHSMTAKLVSHNEGQRLSEDAHESGLVKGQIISKELFVVLEFSQKMNEQIRLTKNEQICGNSKNEYVYLFFGRIRGYQKSFRNYLTFKSTKDIDDSVTNQKKNSFGDNFLGCCFIF